jgi:hypothetical protein
LQPLRNFGRGADGVDDEDQNPDPNRRSADFGADLSSGGAASAKTSHDGYEWDDYYLSVQYSIEGKIDKMLGITLKEPRVYQEAREE